MKKINNNKSLPLKNVISRRYVWEVKIKLLSLAFDKGQFPADVMTRRQAFETQLVKQIMFFLWPRSGWGGSFCTRWPLSDSTKWFDVWFNAAVPQWEPHRPLIRFSFSFLVFPQHRKQSRYLGDEQAAWPQDITSLGEQEETRASCSHMRSIILRWSRAGGKFSAISPLVQGSYWG